MSSELHADEISDTKKTATFKFIDDKDTQFKSQHKKLIKNKAETAINEVSNLMPNLASSIHFNVLITDRDLTVVNGVSGRADTPTQIEIIISSSYKNGLTDAILDGLEFTLFHELHHTVRGWTIHDNKFPAGIDTAAVNEGLADMFASIYTNNHSNHYSNKVDLDSWVKEIKSLPKNASYSEWMFSHPDGRQAIGYRAGTHIIKKAMDKTDKTILELSKMSVEKIYKLAGY